MDEKDKQIERLFDDYASSLEPNAHLADRAKQKMQQKRKAKRPIFWVGLVSAVAAAVAVAVFSVSSFFGSDDIGGSGDNSATPTTPGSTNSPATPSLQSYSINEVRAVAVDADFAKDYINTTELSNAEVFSQTYYACYIKKTNKFVYLKAVLGVSYNGGNIQMSIIAENADYANKELTAEYNAVVDNKYMYTVEFVRGEYVTKAYCKNADYNYYVTTMGNTYGAQNIAKEIIGA